MLPPLKVPVSAVGPVSVGAGVAGAPDRRPTSTECSAEPRKCGRTPRDNGRGVRGAVRGRRRKRRCCDSVGRRRVLFSREQRAVLRAARPEASIGRVGALKPGCEGL